MACEELLSQCQMALVASLGACIAALVAMNKVKSAQIEIEKIKKGK